MDQIGGQMVRVLFSLQLPDGQIAALPRQGGIAQKGLGTGLERTGDAGQLPLI